MARLRFSRSERCTHLAFAAWTVVLAWFFVALWAAIGWVGAGPAFLAWSGPAVGLALVTYWWLTTIDAAPGRALVLLLLTGWAALGLAVWDGGNHWLPTWAFPITHVLLIVFPIIVTAVMLWLVRRGGSHAQAV